MKVMLALVGAFLLLDASIAVLMVLLWLVRGHVPDFVSLSLHGVASLVMVALKVVGGPIGAVQLWRLKQTGRFVAAAVLSCNALFTLVTGMVSGANAGPNAGSMWGTILLNVALLVVVVLPAAGRTCEVAVPRGRAPARIEPRPVARAR